MFKKFLVLICISTTLSFSVFADCLEMYQNKLINREITSARVMRRSSLTTITTVVATVTSCALTATPIPYILIPTMMCIGAASSMSCEWRLYKQNIVFGAYSFALGKLPLTDIDENESDCDRLARERYEQRDLEFNFKKFSKIVDERLINCGLVLTFTDLEDQTKTAIIDLDQKSSFCPTVGEEKTTLSSNSFINLTALSVAVAKGHKECINELSKTLLKHDVALDF